MRILVDTRHLNTAKPSGVGAYTMGLLGALFEIDRENEYVLLTSGRGGAGNSKLATGQNICSLHISTPNKLLNLRTLLLDSPTLNWHAKNSIDLIFLPNLNITTLPEDIPTVLTLHDLSWKLYPEFYSTKMQLWHKACRPNKLADQAAAIITPSSATAQDAHALMGVPTDRLHVIAHGADPQFDHRQRAQDHGVRGRLHLPRRFALHVGTIEPRKNLLTLVEAMIDYRRRTRDDLHLVLAGSWGWRSGALRHRLWQKDTKGWVHLLDYAKKEDLPALYRSAQVTIVPSVYEGFGLPALESMSCGTPVIATHTSSLPEVVSDAGILIDPSNPIDISTALEHLLGSDMLRKDLVQRGLERAKTFTWERAAKQTLSVFQNVAQQKKPDHSSPSKTRFRAGGQAAA